MDNEPELHNIAIVVVKFPIGWKSYHKYFDYSFNMDNEPELHNIAIVVVKFPIGWKSYHKYFD